MKQYGLTRLILGFGGFIELPLEEYLLIKQAQNSLLEALFIEEKFDILLENYFEYELTLLSLAAHDMLFRDLDSLRAHSDRRLMSRRIANLLSSGKPYAEQVLHHIREVYGKKSAQYEMVLNVTRKQYDSLFGYQVMEALRNYAQHRGYPIHSLSYNRQVAEENNLAFLVIPWINVTTLANDDKFKKSVAREIVARANKGNLLDIRPLVREYIDGLYLVHSAVRDLMDEDLQKWEERLKKTMQLSRDSFGDVVGLAVVMVEDGKYVEQIPVFEELMIRRHELEKKNQILERLRNRFVTNIVT